jgi:nitrite reductase/ring-hydroxylating ferredoxin subunit
VRLLGEDLVVFRDRSGRLGLLHKHCAHRGTSLEFGIPAERGIRCCYHGWNFDVDGTILETPAEPPTSRLRENFCQGAYRVIDRHGLLFAYLGPPEATPPFPAFDTFGFPAENQLAPFKLSLPCNWLQVVENACDPIHNAFLHTIVNGQQFSPAFQVLPALDFVPTPLGFLAMATRRVRDFVFVRSSDIMMPNVSQFPTGANRVERESCGANPYVTRWAVPLDDHNSLYIGFGHLNEHNRASRDLSPDKYGVGKIPFTGQTGDRPYEERQREPGDYDALSSQGRIANRKAEHLGTADRGIVLFRRMLKKAIADLSAPQATENGDVKDERVPTFVHEVVLRFPPDVMTDLDAIAKFGRATAQLFIETAGPDPAQRERLFRERVDRLVADAHKKVTA